MMIDGIPNRPLYFYQKDIIAMGAFERWGPILDNSSNISAGLFKELLFLKQVNAEFLDVPWLITT